jgi:hypothetical protein
MTTDATHIDRLLDAIELIQANQRADAVPLLRNLISENQNFEEAWLWMSVAVDSIDQSVICLENVLRVNPQNWQAAGALYRLREAEVASQSKRASLRFYRDMAFTALYLLIVFSMVAIVVTYPSSRP